MTLKEYKMKSPINLSENLITTKINPSKVMILIVLVIISIVLISSVLLFNFEENSIISTSVSAIAIITLIASGVMAFSLEHTVYKESGSPLLSKTIDFPSSKFTEIKDAVGNGKWMALPELTHSGSGATMKLEVVYSKDKSFAAYQFFHYVPHSYEKCSEIYFIKKEHIALNLK